MIARLHLLAPLLLLLLARTAFAGQCMVSGDLGHDDLWESRMRRTLIMVDFQAIA